METAPLQLHSLLNHHCRHRGCCYSAPIASRPSYSCLQISVHFLLPACNRGPKSNVRWSPHCEIFMVTPFENPVLLWKCLPACLPACPIAASQFPCIMPPHCCRFRSVPSSRAAPSKFRMTTFVETPTSKVSSSPKVFKSQLTTPPRRLGSFFSHAIPTFSPPNIRFFT